MLRYHAIADVGAGGRVAIRVVGTSLESAIGYQGVTVKVDDDTNLTVWFPRGFDLSLARSHAEVFAKGFAKQIGSSE